MGRVSAAAPPESRGRRLNGSPACGAGPSPSRGYRSPRTGCGPPALRVKVTLIWPMLSTTPSPPRSQAQISTQSRGLRTSPSLEIPTTVEISIQGQSQCHVPSLAALTTVEEAVAATPPVMTATEARMEEGATDPATMGVIMVEMAIPRTATHKNQKTSEASKIHPLL
ncbi:glycoprotein Xg isoform X5 [Balaenoptera acutorostrata]|uniref:Glycoprotein Xg isoform X5 n=1 Tax=Balaenoptera acutorostrata TaxID=9767 RepID=A0ABM3SYZ1_BALAC|nr:glycoprotein Xg isoform X5 [Balaenoptera acutorostrata]